MTSLEIALRSAGLEGFTLDSRDDSIQLADVQGLHSSSRAVQIAGMLGYTASFVSTYIGRNGRNAVSMTLTK